MKLKIEDDLLVTLIYILSGIMMIGQFFGLYAVTSFAYALSFIIVFGLWCMHLKKCRIVDILTILILAISFICVIATCTVISVNYFTNWLIFSSVFIYFSVCLKIRLKAQTVKNLFGINFIVVVCCCIAYIVRFNDAFYVTNTGVRYLVFDFYNPNCLALFLFCIALTGILNYFFSERLYLIKQICFISLFSILIAQTLSRTTLIAFLIFVVIYIMFKRKKRYFLPNSIIFNLSIALFPLIFAIVYMFLIDNLANNDIFSFLISEGKGLDSRQIVWKYAFDLFKESPICGSYGYLLNSSVFSQMHNSHLNVLISYGVIVFVLVVAFLFLIMNEVCANSKLKRSELSVWAFIMCLVLGSGEAILFSGGLSFYLLAGQFLLFSNVCNENGGELKQ